LRVLYTRCVRSCNRSPRPLQRSSQRPVAATDERIVYTPCQGAGLLTTDRVPQFQLRNPRTTLERRHANCDRFRQFTPGRNTKTPGTCAFAALLAGHLRNQVLSLLLWQNIPFIRMLKYTVRYDINRLVVRRSRRRCYILRRLFLSSIFFLSAALGAH